VSRYLVQDLKHDRKAAVKVLKPELAAVLGAERFVAEIKTTAALQHPRILSLSDSGEADGFPYCVMPRRRPGVSAQLMIMSRQPFVSVISPACRSRPLRRRQEIIPSC